MSTNIPFTRKGKQKPFNQLYYRSTLFLVLFKEAKSASEHVTTLPIGGRSRDLRLSNQTQSDLKRIEEGKDNFLSD